MKSKVYILPDSDGRILQCEGGYTIGNITDFSHWVLIDEGIGDKFNLCQTHYLPGGVLTVDDIPRYKLVSGIPVLRAEEEIEADRVNVVEPDQTKTLEERVNTLELDTAETKEALEMILSGVTE